MRGTPTTDRGRRLLAAGLVAVCLVVAGVIQQTADRLSSATAQVYVDRGLGQAGDLPFGRVTVLQVRAAAVVVEGDERTRSTGRFVVVDYQVEAIAERMPSLDVELLSDDRRYRPVTDEHASTPPGFLSTGYWVFELPTDQLTEDLRLEIAETEIVSRVPRCLRVGLDLDESASAGTAVARLKDPQVRAR